MAFNPNIINTNVPPPSYPNVPMQFSSHLTNPCPTPPIPQEHMFNTGMHVPLANPPFNVVPANNLPPPSVGLGFVQNPMSTMWNKKDALNLPLVNNQNYTSGPPISQIASCFQVPPPVQNKHFQTSIWSIQPQNNPNGLLAISPNSSSGNNQSKNSFTQNFAPARSDFQSAPAQFNGNLGRNNGLVWSSHNSSSNEPHRSSNNIPMTDNQSPYNISRDAREKTWNPIQKTNVPDSNIFQNPCAILNEVSPGNPHHVAKKQFQDFNGTFHQGNMSSSQQFIPLNGDSAPNYNRSLKNQNRFFQQTHDLNKNQFHQTKKQDIDYHSNNFKQDSDYRNNNFNFGTPNYSDKQDLPFQHNNQNLIDVFAASSNDAAKFKPSNPNFFHSNNYCRSNSSSTITEEFTISDCESIDNKNSPQKYPRNKKFFENLQKINAESSINTFQPKKGWMTENIQKALQKRNMLFKQAKTTNDPAVWDEYNKLKNEINEEIRQAKNTKAAKNNKPKRNTPRVWQDKVRQFPFNCDTCDRGFSSKDELELHMALHIKCHHLGCNFKAHPKVVHLHQRMQHDTGYADVINKLQNDEEIKKWREERKRRFPTAENILKKKAEQAEKEARGEVIEEKNYGQFKKRRFDDRNKDNSSNRRDRNNRKRRSRNPFQKAPEIDLAEDSVSDGESECPTKLPKFRGMANGFDHLLNNKIENVGDLKVEEIGDAAIQTSKGLIISSSGQQELDDDDEAPFEIPIQKVSLNEYSDSADENEIKPLAVVEKQELLHQIAEDSSPVGPNTEEKSESNEILSLPSKDNKGHKKERNEKRCRPPIPPRPKNSLLKMLLSEEIRHERNVIMQCIRHIVRSNFFKVDANS